MRPACLSFVLRTRKALLLLLLLLLLHTLSIQHNTPHMYTQGVNLPARVFLDFTRSYSEAPQRRPANAFTLFTPTPSVPLPKSDAWWPRAIDLKKRKTDEQEGRREKDGGGGRMDMNGMYQCHLSLIVEYH